MDVSGSMGDHIAPKPPGNYTKRCQPALKTAVLVAEAAEKAGLNYFVIPWETVVRDWKRIGQPLNDIKEQMGADIAQPSGGTYEAPALMLAVEEFKRARSSHKILITLSDGQTRQKEESAEVIWELENAGVRCVAIGIQTPPAHHYTRQIFVDDPAELIDIIPKAINDMMRKGGGDRS